MNDTLKQRCKLFMSNRDIIKENFGWESIYMYPLCANIFVTKNQTVDVERMQEYRKLLKQRTNIFSSFRRTSKLATISYLAVDENPEEKMNNLVKVYKLLTNVFYASESLPVTALIITDLADPEDYEYIVGRTRRIYDLMKEQHRFLTSTEDCTLAAILAFSEKKKHQLIDDMVSCFKILSEYFDSKNAVQSLTHVLTLGAGTAEEKCRRTIELYETLKSNGYNYGTEYELPALGVLALLPADIEKLAYDMIDVDDYLCKKTGFNAFGVGVKQRLMYAGMLVSEDYIEAPEKHEMNAGVINSTIAFVIAQEAAMCAAIAAHSVLH